MRSNRKFAILVIAASFIFSNSISVDGAYAQQSASEDIQDEIVVIGKKLSTVKFDFKVTNEGEVKKCELTKPSGDPDIDALPCKVVATCSIGGFKKRKQLLDCMSSEWKASVRSLAERRLNTAS
jgi:hypothetical protein